MTIDYAAPGVMTTLTAPQSALALDLPADPVGICRPDPLTGAGPIGA